MICGGGPDDMTDDLPSGTWTRTECGVQGPSRVLREYSSGCDQTVEYSPGVPIPELTELVAAAEDESYTWDTGDEESYQTNDGFG